MNRKLIFVGLLLGLFIFPLFLNIHKVNADDGHSKSYEEPQRNLADIAPPGTDGDACQGQQRGITDLSALLEKCRGDQDGAQGELDLHKTLLEESGRTLTATQSALDKALAEVAQNFSQSQEANDQIKELSGQLEESGRTLTATQSALDKALAEVAQNFSQSQEANDQIKELSGQLEESRTRAAGVSSMIEATIEELTNQLSASEARAAAAEEQISSLTSRLEALSPPAQHPVADEPVPNTAEFSRLYFGNDTYADFHEPITLSRPKGYEKVEFTTCSTRKTDEPVPDTAELCTLYFGDGSKYAQFPASTPCGDLQTEYGKLFVQ